MAFDFLPAAARVAYADASDHVFAAEIPFGDGVVRILSRCKDALLLKLGDELSRLRADFERVHGAPPPPSGSSAYTADALRV